MRLITIVGRTDVGASGTKGKLLESETEHRGRDCCERTWIMKGFHTQTDTV